MEFCVGRTILKIKEEVAYRKADDGTMTIVSPITDKIITVNASATELWELIDGNTDVDRITEIFISRHKEDKDFPGDSEAAEHVSEIIGEFLKRKLIERIK